MNQEQERWCEMCEKQELFDRFMRGAEAEGIALLDAHTVLYRDAVVHLQTANGQMLLRMIMNRVATQLKEDERKMYEREQYPMLTPARGVSAHPPKMQVHVPSLKARDLLILVQQECGMKALEPSVASWDLYRGQDGVSLVGPGQTYEAAIFQFPGTARSFSSFVRQHISTRGYVGHTGAFLAWLLEARTVGNFTSLPSDDNHLELQVGREARVLTASFPVRGEASLGLRTIREPWPREERWWFVGFRLI